MIQETDITSEHKFNDFHESPRAYWSILKMFLNKKKF